MTDTLLAISAFGRRVGLTPSALRFYDDCGLLRPAEVDDQNGYRYYSPDQEPRAVLLRDLREIDLPLAEVRVVLDEGPTEGVAVVRAHLRTVESKARSSRAAKLTVRGIVLLYLGLLLVLPVAMVFIRAFEGGIQPILTAIQRPAFQSAFLLTLEITLITVPVCTVLGVITALAIARRRFPGRSIINALVDLPFASTTPDWRPVP